VLERHFERMDVKDETCVKKEQSDLEIQTIWT